MIKNRRHLSLSCDLLLSLLAHGRSSFHAFAASGLICIATTGCGNPPHETSSYPAGDNAHPHATPSSAEMPLGHPLVGGTGAAKHLKVNYNAPEGWQALPASGIRKVAFRVADGSREALVTVIDFSAAAGPMIADQLANVNRWRSEVGLPPIPADDLSAATEPIEINSVRGIYAEAVPQIPENAEPVDDIGTLAAMATAGEVVWFIKITGDRRLVVSQRDQFKTFLKSLRFTARDESKDIKRLAD